MSPTMGFGFGGGGGEGGGSDCWKMACLHPVSRINEWILTKLVFLYCCDMEKN